jgi:hypothetical protein
MKDSIKKILSVLVRNNVTWFFLKPFSSFGGFLFWTRTHKPEDELNKNIEKKLFKDLVVRNGPFKGLKYPRLDSVCSSIYPKLLGSYEKELWETIKIFSKNKYTEIIDIGCAEGYYAIGLSIKIPRAKIYAYDTDKKARMLCQEMASLNDVADRVIIRSTCTAQELKIFNFSGRGLIVCDCEGFEKELFNKNNVKNLKNCDLIIEAHDLIDMNISGYLKEVFSKTHKIQSIKSIDDIEKVHTYVFAEFKNLTLNEKKKILEERRRSIMEWLICTPI